MCRLKNLRLWSFSLAIKVIYSKYSKHCPYTVAHTIDCVCNKMLNHGLNHGLFLSLFKLFIFEVSLFQFMTWAFIHLQVFQVICNTYSVDRQWRLESIHTLLLSRSIPLDLSRSIPFWVDPHPFEKRGVDRLKTSLTVHTVHWKCQKLI